MRLRRLRLENFRLFDQVEIEFGERWNVLEGPNGAGKTSVLEAAFLLSHGRSFRTSVREALVRNTSQGYSVFGSIEHDDGRGERVGLSRSRGRLEARLNGDPVGVGELMRHVGISCFEPGSHELISGGGEERRRFLDWGVFHVEHDFLAVWRRCQRALRQRNALLRQGEEGLDAWDRELAASAMPLASARRAYFDRFAVIASGVAARLLPELGPAEFTLNPGYDPEVPLEEQLAVRRSRDLARGHTTVGPHRADWSVGFASAPRREHLSRGQEKLCAFACVLAQAELFRQVSTEPPVFCLDDLASEVDVEHQQRIVASVDSLGAQVLVTGTEPSRALTLLESPAAMFHVEQGRVTRLL